MNKITWYSKKRRKVVTVEFTDEEYNKIQKAVGVITKWANCSLEEITPTVCCTCKRCKDVV